MVLLFSDNFQNIQLFNNSRKVGNKENTVLIDQFLPHLKIFPVSYFCSKRNSEDHSRHSVNSLIPFWLLFQFHFSLISLFPSVDLYLSRHTYIV